VPYGELDADTPVIEDPDVTLQFHEEDRAGGSGGSDWHLPRPVLDSSPS